MLTPPYIPVQVSQMGLKTESSVGLYITSTGMCMNADDKIPFLQQVYGIWVNVVVDTGLANQRPDQEKRTRKNIVIHFLTVRPWMLSTK